MNVVLSKDASLVLSYQNTDGFAPAVWCIPCRSQLHVPQSKMSSAQASKSLNIVIDAPETFKFDYEFIELPNKLLALVISDPSTDKSAASMEVGVGHFQDPNVTINYFIMC